MPIPLPRFRIRTLMIAVAVVALTLGVALWVRRENERQALAFLEATLQAHHRGSIARATSLFRELSARDQPPDIPPDPLEPPDSPEPE